MEVDLNRLDHVAANPDSHRIRCPKCRKLYVVRAQDIKETRPRFECVGCYERFWVSFVNLSPGEEILGLPLDTFVDPKSKVLSPSPSEDPAPVLPGCPKCHARMEPGVDECAQCGVIPAKYLALRTGSRIQGSERLSQLWKKILANYADPDLHEEFVATSFKENNLAYASYQYAQLLKVLPQDEIARSKVKEIEALITLPLVHHQMERDARTLPRPTFPRWQMMLVVFGLMLIGVGMIVPQLRQVVGLGAVLLFLAVSFRLKIFKL